MALFNKAKLLKNPFLRRVSLLVGGTAIGQFISVISLPILTRLYSPEAFSNLAIYVSILSLLTAISCMRLEIAIPLPKSNKIAAALCTLSIISTISFSILITLVILYLPDLFIILTDNKIKNFIWLIPLGVLAVGIYNALQYWSTRNKKFNLISKTRITQSIGGNSIKLGSGFLFNGSITGLILGQFLSQSVGFISLGLSLIKNDWNIFKKLKFNHLKIALKRYDKFPKYSILEAFANIGSIQIPILIIASYYITSETGYLMIAMQILAIPMTLIGSAVSQVYLADASQYFHQGKLKQFTRRTIINLSKLAFFPLLLTAIISPFAIPYILGDEWQRTGILISWMVPWFFMQFITSPISMSLHITGNQKIALFLQVFGLAIRVGLVSFALKFHSSYIGEYYALSGFIFYLIYQFTILSIINKK
ncbi:MULTISPECIES: lipopolysaccharide biosynthesis protein [Providencia]|nr:MULTISPECIES: oligosaccharide flippase family protein [Providencia]ELR5292995.1 oligosaccharide flippase family protein [Providencia stuartii]MCR4181946.1 oligosaccharide flippase family protein [Providencia vermicola]QIC17635.1 oligosaccharide flippase family protein [Providencia vermicola]URE78551.1 oligosaccharide flippase family protein [Providencia stuartii]